MANYTATITTAGLALLQAVSNAGGTLAFTKTEAGDGVLGEADPAELTALINKEQTSAVVDAKKDGDGEWYAFVEFSNINVTTGYLRREMGIFAKLASDAGSETLLVYFHAADDEEADYVPAADSGTGLLTSFAVKITQAAGLSVTVTLDQSTAHLPLSRWAQHLGGVGGVDQHPVADGLTYGLVNGTMLVPAGAVMPFAMSAVPSGWLECKGNAVLRSMYPRLFAAIGTTYGEGNGSTTFTLPDLRGEFVRGWDHGRGVDAGRALGSAQGDELRSHTHVLPSDSGGSSDMYSLASTPNADEGFTGADVTAATGGAETRPRNIALMYCIKY